MPEVRSIDTPDTADQPATDLHGLLAAIDRSPIAAPELSMAALRTVLAGVITGEGPTTQGRVHYSRALDAEDAALCARILTARGMDQAAVTHGEADMLFEINAAAADRADAGRCNTLISPRRGLVCVRFSRGASQWPKILNPTRQLASPCGRVYISGPDR